jgi:glutamate-ammonia-ligase adenylyltransferase
MTQSGNDKNDLQLRGVPMELHMPVHHWADRLTDQYPDFGRQLDALGEQQVPLLRLVASSEYAAAVIARDWVWFHESLGKGLFQSRVDQQSLIAATLDIGADNDDAAVRSRLRRLRNRSLLHILWRALNAQDQVFETLRALSSLADALIEASMLYAERSLFTRFGYAMNADGKTIPLVVLAMGKLGGEELNFSSDIDLVFLYTEDGDTNGARSLSAREYFTRLSQLVVSLLDEVTEDGFVYRVDTRLRPFGESGPPVVSFSALENYLLQHGRSWERYAYVKARVLSPGARASDIRDLRTNVIEPFVYRRYLDYGVFESLREMKALIANEIRQRSLQDNIKLGPGGIREIEFIVQSLQLVRGGADEKLRRSELREALTRLGHSRGLGRAAVPTLLNAYDFLRKLENGIQAIRDQQTHDLPHTDADRARLQLVMGYSSWVELVNDLNLHRQRVTEQFSEVAFRGGDTSAAESDLDLTLSALWKSRMSVDDLSELLDSNGYEEPTLLASALIRFAETLLPGQIDATARKRLDRFMQGFLLSLRERSNPGIVCERVLAIISQIVRRSAYVALLNENPAALERLVGLCDQSNYLAGEIARYPLLLDELLDSRLYSTEISSYSIRTDLEERLTALGAEDSERKIEALAQFQRATLFRIAVADISGDLPIMKVSDRLTDLAEIVLEHALKIAWDDLVKRHGQPVYELDGRLCDAGFGVIAYGKLGGIELSYRSDLDLVFLHDSQGVHQETNGANPLDNSMFFGRLVRRLVHFLTAQTPSGVLYEVDTRLRPSGRRGLLVVNLDGFEKYQEDNAWTWEHQALLRSRPVAGSAKVAREFERIRADTLRNRVRRDRLLQDVLSMRAKMRKQLDKSNEDLFDLKQGEGGIGDIEFLVQYLVLKNAQEEPALIHYSDNIRQLGALEAVGCLLPADVLRLQNAYRAFRLATHRFALDDKPPLVPDAEFANERQFVISVWQREMGETVSG